MPGKLASLGPVEFRCVLFMQVNGDDASFCGQKYHNLALVDSSFGHLADLKALGAERDRLAPKAVRHDELSGPSPGVKCRPQPLRPGEPEYPCTGRTITRVTSGIG